MKQKYCWAACMGLFVVAAVHAQNVGIVVVKPQPLPGVYGGGVPLDCPRPAYPSEARRYELEGKTIVELLIDNDGRAYSPHVFASSGWKMLDEATLSSMAACRFSPITRNGVPAGAHWKKLAFVWKLEDGEGKRASRPVLLSETCGAGGDRLVLADNALGARGILLRFLTSPQGTAFGIKIEKGSGDPATDDEAVKTLQKCSFVPSQVDGRPVPGNAIARYYPSDSGRD